MREKASLNAIRQVAPVVIIELWLPLTIAASVDRLDSGSVPTHLIKRERSDDLGPFNTTVPFMRHNQMVYIGLQRRELIDRLFLVSF